ncbi:MAG: hypothetical protein ABFR65_06605, partial [Pseudomonadota bacterium]
AEAARLVSEDDSAAAIASDTAAELYGLVIAAQHIDKQFLLLDLVLSVYDAGAELIELGVPVQQLAALPVMARLRRCKELYDSSQTEQLRAFQQEALGSFQAIRSEYAQREEPS